MKLKITYDQIPHVISNHPLMTNDAEVVFKNIYKILKDKPRCTYSNKALSEASRVGLRSLDNCLSLLESIGAIIRTGLKQNRRFHRGLLLISAHNQDTYAPDAYVSDIRTDFELNTYAPDAHAYAPDAHAYAPDAHILIPTIKNFTTKTDVVVIISKLKDEKLKAAYEQHKHELQSDDINNVNDLLVYCKWYLDKGKSEGINEDGRFNQIIKFLNTGSLRIDRSWAANLKLNEKQKSNKIVGNYQEYASRIKSDIDLGLIPASTSILDFETWKKINEK